MIPRVSSAPARPADPARRDPRTPGTRRTRAVAARPLLLALALLAATMLAYAPALDAGYVWDDDDYVTQNPLLWEPDGLRRIWLSTDQPSQYFPLTYTSFRLEHALWGLEPFGYHLVNVLLHAANALLLVAVLGRLGLPGAWLAGALFALHPVHVESVAWITERKNTLSTLFFLLALLAWLRFDAAPPRAGRHFYAASLGAHALALLAKTTACTFPAAQLLALWVKGRPLTRSRWLEVAPFLALGIAMGLVTLWWERMHQGTRGERFAMSLAESALVAGRAVWFYLGKLAWPAELVFSYPRFEVDPSRAVHWLPLLALLVLLAALWLGRRALGRGPVAALVFFVAMLSPVLGFIPLYTFLYTWVADHYQYVASMGPLALFAGAVARWPGARAPRASAAASLLLLAALGALSFTQSRTYRDAETLWRDVLAKNPASWMAHANLGRELLRAGRGVEALPHYREAARLRPDLATPHAGLGAALLQAGDSEGARAAFERALAVDADHWPAQRRLAALRWREGDREAAVLHYEAAARIAPRDADSRVALAQAQAAVGREADAEQSFRAALAQHPDHLGALRGLVRLLTTCPGGRLPARGEASIPAERALALRPGQPALVGLLARARAAEGDLASAAALARRARARAEASGRAELARALGADLARYQAGVRCAERAVGRAAPESEEAPDSDVEPGIAELP